MQPRVRFALLSIPVWGTALYTVLIALERRFLGFGIVGALYNILFWIIPLIGTSVIVFDDNRNPLAKIASGLAYLFAAYILSLFVFLAVGSACGIPGP